MKNGLSDSLRMVLAVSVLTGSVGVSLGEGQGGDGSVRANRAADRAAARAAAKEKAESRVEAAKERREVAREKASEAGAARVDKRESNQSKRIQHGIAKGYLTADEVAKLNTQQQSIATLEASLKSDGKLTAKEFLQIRTELNEASRCIWAEKHDTDGNQMATFRLGKNVFAKGDLTSQLANENLSKADAKALLKDFHRTVQLKNQLATGELSATERAKLQAEYDELLNKYFEVK